MIKKSIIQDRYGIGYMVFDNWMGCCISGYKVWCLSIDHAILHNFLIFLAIWRPKLKFKTIKMSWVFNLHLSDLKSWIIELLKINNSGSFEALKKDPSWQFLNLSSSYLLLERSQQVPYRRRYDIALIVNIHFRVAFLIAPPKLK